MPRRRTLIALLILADALGLTGAVSAEWFADLLVGGAFTESHDVKRNTTTFSDVSFDTSGVVGARGGYWMADLDWAGLSFDILHYRPDIGAQSVTASAGSGQLGKADLSVVAFSLDFMFRYPLLSTPEFPRGRLQPYAFFGPTMVNATLSDTTNFGLSASQSDATTRVGFNGGTGVAWQYHQRVAVFTEYRYLQFSPHWSFGRVGRVSTEIASHFLMTGVSFRF
jgi:opacity protein-like surface antigen